jgi:uracil-DNA glycosylase
MIYSENIQKQFGTWAPLFKEFIESDKFDSIFTNLKMQKQAGRILIPDSSNVFKSFELTDKDKLKCIFFLMDPYPSFKDGKMISDGVPMSCKNTGILQPSLQLFYDAIEGDYLGFDPGFDARPDNSYLLKEEHILLINTSLTVEKDKVGSHSQMWMPFMKFFIEEVLNKYFSGLPIILCGQSAQKLERYFNPMLHYIKKVEHPVAASYQNRMWKHDDVFKWINNLIRVNNGPECEIRWFRKKGESGATDEVLPDWLTDSTIRHHINEEAKDNPLPKAQDMGLPWRDE